MLILDSALGITVFNRALSRLTGWAAADALGQRMTRLCAGRV